ncbi:hypothetical protein ACVWYO_004309 [Sphingomonas sp. UYP23]
MSSALRTGYEVDRARSLDGPQSQCVCEHGLELNAVEMFIECRLADPAFGEVKKVGVRNVWVTLR